MARIPDEELARLKRETDLVALVQAAGVQLRRHGANLVGRCPFHEDRGPSLVVTPGKGLWHCLGACQAGGSVVDWVMRTERVSFRHAVELLRTRAGAHAGSPALPEPPAIVPLADVELADLDDAALMRAVVAFYHDTLTTSPEAIAYLERRGLNSVALIDRFQLGYANRTLGYRLPPKALAAGAAVRGRLQRLGLLRASGHEHFTGSLVVPILGARGQLVQCYGRKLRDDLREGTPRHLYLPGPHAGVWNEEALAASPEIILCEALLDALTFWVAGHRHVITSYGVSGFTDAHRAALRRYGTERVLIAYDGDEAGERAAERVADELARLGIEGYRVHFPRGMDANAYALAEASNAPASDSLGMLLRGATWLGRPAPLVPGALIEGAPIAGAAVESKPVAAPSLAAPSLAAPSLATAPIEPLASPAPAPPSSGLAIERRGDDVHGTVGDRAYRVRGLAKNLSPDALRVNLLAQRGESVHVDTLDLYAARARGLFITQAAKELGSSEELIKRDVGALLLALEALVAEQIAGALTPAAPAVPAMTEAERTTALDLLRDPRLLDRILTDFERAGVVGEETNKLVGYLAAVSRKLAEPLAVIIQSASAAGKTSLMDAVLAFVPPEERVQYSAMTGQALFYMAETNLTHKVLAVVEEEGAERASYALKLLQSEGELTIASTGKDPATGKLVTHEYRVAGPVMIMLTTTAVELDEELVNRALVLTVDEDRAQTRAIHQRQRARRTLDGLLATVARTEVLTLHRNAQRLLESVPVVNPYAPRLTFLDVRTRTRRDHEKYLTLIDAVAFLHQHQRERRTIERDGQTLGYIEVTLDDIAVANRLADAVLGRSLDELPPQARKLVALLTRMVHEMATRERAEPRTIHFSRRAVREYTGWTDFQVRVHLQKLEALEYVLAHRGARGQCYVYELLYQGEGDDDRTSGEPAAPRPRLLMGLLDVERLRHSPDYDRDVEGSVGGFEPRTTENEYRPSPGRALDVPTSSGAGIVDNVVPVPELLSRHPIHAYLRRASRTPYGFSRMKYALFECRLSIRSVGDRCENRISERHARAASYHSARGAAMSTITTTIAAHLAALAASGSAASTMTGRRAHLGRFAEWCDARGVTTLQQLTPAVLERYQHGLTGRRTRDGATLAWSTQANLLTAVRMLLAWATRTKRLALNPAADLARPRLPKRLPRAVLSVAEAERVLAQPDLTTALGLRDRAILEVLYSTGIRRMELVGLDLPDLDAERGVLLVREGKGKKDRLVPIGERAIRWTERYLDPVRERLVERLVLRGRGPPRSSALFLSARGTRIRPTRLTERLHGYLVASGVAKPGSCHVWRHTAATLMHDGGADIRDLQEMLGHAQLSTTQLYTHVSIERLKAVHAKTHPAHRSLPLVHARVVHARAGASSLAAEGATRERAADE